jgi:hypothetical protein
MTIEVCPDGAIHEFPDEDGARGHEKRRGAALRREARGTCRCRPRYSP